MAGAGFSPPALDRRPSTGKLSRPSSSRLRKQKYDFLCRIFLGVHLQLAIRKEHTCRSSGYSFRFIGHDSVSEILKHKIHTQKFL